MPRHSISPYFDGMENHFPHYDEPENKEAYDISQQQRMYERRIRKTKQVIQSLEQVQPDSPLLSRKRKLLQKQLATYSDYCKEHDLRPQSVRLQIARAERQQNLERFNTARKQTEEVWNPYRMKKDYTCKLASTGEMTKEIYDRTVDLLNNAPDTYTKAFLVENMDGVNVGSIHAVDKNMRHRAYYSHATNTINFNVKDVFYNNMRKEGSTIFHESGHWLDYNCKMAFERPQWEGLPEPSAEWFNETFSTRQPLSARYKNGAFPETIREDVDDLIKRTQKELKAKGLPATKKDAYAFIHDEIEALSDHQRHSVSDLLDGATYTKKFNLSWGHKKTYFNTTNYGGYKFNALEKRIYNNQTLATEAFAEMLEAQITGPESWEMLQKYLPKSSQMFLDMMEELMKDRV